jgi:hypothetical protein
MRLKNNQAVGGSRDEAPHRCCLDGTGVDRLCLTSTARAQLKAGSTDFLTVLYAVRKPLLARDRLAQGRTGAAVALVSVYRALAGDW